VIPLVGGIVDGAGSFHGTRAALSEGMRQSLTEIYDARVAEGRLHADPAQRAALPLLEAVRAALEAPAKKPGLFKRWGGAWQIHADGFVL